MSLVDFIRALHDRYGNWADRHLVGTIVLALVAGIAGLAVFMAYGAMPITADPLNAVRLAGMAGGLAGVFGLGYFIYPVIDRYQEKTAVRDPQSNEPPNQ